jgi:hypothetical protein
VLDGRKEVEAEDEAEAEEDADGGKDRTHEKHLNKEKRRHAQMTGDKNLFCISTVFKNGKNVVLQSGNVKNDREQTVFAFLQYLKKEDRN